MLFWGLGLNSYLAAPSSPRSLVESVWRHRELILLMCKREIAARYRGSIGGVVWALLTPFLMLGVYTFVFSQVFMSRWPAAGDSVAGGANAGGGSFAALVCVGLLVHGFLAQVLSRAPTLVTGNATYVKRIVFPLELLPVVAVATALLDFAMGIGILVAALWILNGAIPATALLLPVCLIPLLLLACGVAWWLSSLGVYVRDIGQVVGLGTTMLMFLSPVFFPVAAVPLPFRHWMELNPLTPIIEQTRGVLVFGLPPGMGAWAVSTSAASMFAWLGYVWFQNSRDGFADVI